MRKLFRESSLNIFSLWSCVYCSVPKFGTNGKLVIFSCPNFSTLLVYLIFVKVKWRYVPYAKHQGDAFSFCWDKSLRVSSFRYYYRYIYYIYSPGTELYRILCFIKNHDLYTQQICVNFNFCENRALNKDWILSERSTESVFIIVKVCLLR